MACGQKVRIGLVALALAVMGACGDDGGDDAAGGDSVGGGTTTADGRGGREYGGELEDGSRLTVRLDVGADDPVVAPYDAFRALTGVDEPTWIVAEISVPEGVDGTGRFVTFIEEGVDPFSDDPFDDTDGVVSSTFVCGQLVDWFAASAEPDEALDDAYQELYQGPCGGQTFQVIAPAGETTTYVLVLDGPLPAFESIRAGFLTELEPT